MPRTAGRKTVQSIGCRWIDGVYPLFNLFPLLILLTLTSDIWSHNAKSISNSVAKFGDLKMILGPGKRKN
jgi:hypothetical protein